MHHWGLQLKETNKSDVNSHTRPEMRQLYCLFSPSLFICEASDWSGVCVASVRGAPSLKATLVSHTCHHTRITCHVRWSSVEPAKKKATQREDLRGKCGSATFNLVLKFKKKKKKMCADWVTSNLRLLQHFLLWKQMTFKSAVSASSLRDPQVSLCITTPFSTLVKLLIPRC